MRVLIVDDTPANLRLLRAVLEGENFQVVEASDGVQALAVLERESVDAIISDILMPNMDGYRLCLEVRRRERLRNLPFIVYTATYTSPSDEKLSLDLGADKYIKKPASSSVIVDALREVTNRTRFRNPNPAERPEELILMKEYNQQLVIKLEEKNAELQTAHEELREILEYSPAVLYRLKLEAQKIIPVLVSENINRLLGFCVAETLSFDWWQRQLHPEDRLRAEASLSDSIAQGACSLEYRLRHKDGSYRWIEDNRRLVRDSSGRPSDLVGVWTDLTARKEVEQALQASDRRFREMLENVEMIAVTLDTRGKITFCNDYLLRITGHAREEVMGGDWFSLFIPETDTELKKQFFETMEVNKLPAHRENPIKTKSGGIRRVVWNNTTLKDGAGRIIGVASLGEDVTEREKHERLARRSQRLEAIGTLAGGVAHDLNNALAPIMMGVEMLRAQNPNETELLDIFHTSAKRSADMVRQLLTFAKGAEGERVSILPRQLIKEMQSIMKGTFPKNIHVLTKAAPDTPSVRGDVTQLHQILLNLCVNARDAMPEGGTLTLEAQRVEVDAAYASTIPDAKPGRYVRFRVCDTGTGIPAEIIDRIFEPFFTTKGPDIGTGLGLSTVMGIAKGHGGFLHVYSQPGEGSTFAVYLPAEGAGNEPDLAMKPEFAFCGNGETILLIDDELAVRDMARRVLRRLNFKPLTATDGADALMQLGEHRPELRAVITDVHMPHMDGLGFVRSLRRMMPDIPVVVASGRMEESLAAEFNRLGVTRYLDKPFTEMQLAEALRNLLAPK